MQFQKKERKFLDRELILKKVVMAIKTDRDLNEPIDENHETYLHKAVILKKERAVRLLLACGADPNVHANYHDSLRNEYDIVTPLHCAVKLGLIEVVVLLLQYGADPNVYTSMMGYTALHLSVISDCLNTLMAYIFYARKSLNIDAVVLNDDFDGWSSLHLAIHLGKIPVIQVLLDSDADVGLKNVSGFVPLQLIKSKDVLRSILNHPRFVNKEMSLVKYLRERGVNFNDSSCPNFKSLFQMAREYGFDRFAKYMEEFSGVQDYHQDELNLLERSFESQLHM